MRFQPAAHGLAVLVAAVILPFQIPRILANRDWAAGTARTMGHIDKMIIGPRISEVRYSYKVNGKRYTGSDTGEVFLEGTPEWVTYAKSKPAVATLMPDQMGGIYVVSWIMAIVGVIPIGVLLYLELLAWFHRRQRLEMRGESADP